MPTGVNVFLRNNTGSDILINDLGVTVPASTTLDVTSQFYLESLRGSEDLRTQIASGDVDILGDSGIPLPLAQFDLFQSGAQVGFGGYLVTPSEIINLDDNVKSITASGVPVSGTVNFETLGGVSIIGDSNTNTLTVSGGGTVGSFVGSFFQVEFTKGGTANNTWLAVGDASLTGNRTPWVVAFPCQLVGMVFSNINSGVDTDVEIYVSRQGDGNSDSLDYTWSLNNVRTASKTDIPSGTLELEPGDKIAVYLNDQGGNPRDVFVGLYLEVVARDTVETNEDWSGNF